MSGCYESRIYCADEDTDAGGQSTLLSVYQADGTPRIVFQNVVSVAGKPEAGVFASFRSPQFGMPTAFSVLFDLSRNGARYQVEIDAASGNILAVQEVR